jgi:hypothetical protein
MDETRCADCKRTVYQCFRCKKVDDATKKALRASAKVLKQSQSQVERDAAKAIKESTKRRKKNDQPLPPSPSQVRQDRFLQIMRKQFLIKEIERDGDCCFNAFAAGYWKVAGVHLTSHHLRKQVSQFLLSSKGQVPGMLYQQFEELADGRIMTCREVPLQSYRGKPLVPMTLEQYVKKIETNLYGGDLEIAVLAHLFKVQIQVYTWQFYFDSNVFAPERFGDLLTTNHVAMLWIQDFDSEIGSKDHYDTVYLDYHSKWRHYMCTMPEWNKDIGPCFSDIGRGIKALRDFHAGDVLLYYDGHRVNSEGSVVFERQAVKQLFEKHKFDPASIEFKRTHAVGLGRSGSIDVFIDGYPLTLPIFDCEPCIGRGALANSASPTESNMRMEWHDAPDLPLDVVDKIRDKEAFLVARKDIRYESCLSCRFSMLIIVAGLVKSCSGGMIIDTYPICAICVVKCHPVTLRPSHLPQLFPLA